MKKYLSTFKYYIISIGLILIVSVILFVQNRNAEITGTNIDHIESLFEEEIIEEEEMVEEIEEMIVVDIKGAVLHPGVYTLAKESRVFELIELAGGLIDGADEYQLNLAQLLQDEMMVHVPLEGEEAIIHMNNNQEKGKIAINEADASTLEQLPGIGPAKAQAIIDYRNEHGPFQEIEDLQKVSGIGPKSLERLRDDIYVR